MKKIFLALVVLLTFTSPVLAEDFLAEDFHEIEVSHQVEPKKDDIKRSISVSGKSVIQASPDMAVIRFAILNTNKEPEKARLENTRVAGLILDAVRAFGVPDKKINLESLEIAEDFRYNPKTNANDSLGFKAIRQLKIVLELPAADSKELSNKLSDLVALVVSKGSNQLQSVEFGLIDSAPLLEQALNMAVANAMQKAERMLEPLVGVKLGKVITLSEQTQMRPPVFARSHNLMLAGAPMADSADHASFSAGNLEVEANISAVFEID
jgi:uncharacterized protein YggE